MIATSHNAGRPLTLCSRARSERAGEQAERVARSADRAKRWVTVVPSLAGEVGRQGVRVVALRPNFTPETVPGFTDLDAPKNVRDTLLGRLPRLREVAGTAVYLASDAAGAMTGAVINLSCGAVFD